jgi:transcriptional regulator with XRE-family HTH domain
MIATARPVGTLLKEWRQRRRLSQLDLAYDAEISARHLSFVETGRAAPSRDMVLRIAEHLQVPLRERNSLLVAAGFAPIYPERPLEDPALQAAREAIDMVLRAHDPFPAFAIDRYWNVLTANRAAGLFFTGAHPHLLEPPLNILRIALHPEGICHRIENFADVRARALSRLKRQAQVSGDPKLNGLLEEALGYRYECEPLPSETSSDLGDAVLMLVKIASDRGTLSFFSTTTVFGTPVEITLAELAIEAFFPANEFTAGILREF